MEFEFEKILDLLSYNNGEPLIFSSGLFLFLFLGFTAGYAMLKRRLNLRILYVVCFSLFFYYKTSGWYLLILVGLSLSDYALGWLLSGAAEQWRRKMLVVIGVCINLGILCYFKYTNLIAETIDELFDGRISTGDIFLPIGISFFTFQSMSYTIDVYRGRIEPVRRWVDYLFYLSFFPQLVAGPIVRAKDFLPQITKNPVVVTPEMFNRGVFLIVSGLFKKAIISDYISLNFVDRIFDAPMLYSGLENLLGVYGYAMQIYCDFSGYSDMAIGIALLLGFYFNPNFDSPYKSATITEFWRRWHISLSSWLKDYLYISLGGNRKGKIRTYINLIVTMLLGGLWHGGAWRFMLWGGIHGVALATEKCALGTFPRMKVSGMEMKRVWRVVGIFLTFNIVCFAWIFFRAENMAAGGEILSQIFTNFSVVNAAEIARAYWGVLVLIGLGYLLHFAPRSSEMVAERFLGRVPLWAKAVIITLIIYVVMHIKSADVQPFIYFQF